VRRPAGLHAEIILTTAFLVAAALLFGGVLLLRLTEQELLDQSVKGAAANLQMLARWVALSEEGGVARLPELFAEVGDHLSAWRFYDADMNLKAASGSGDLSSPEISLLVQQARYVGKPLWVVDRPMIWLPVSMGDPGHIDVAVALNPKWHDTDVLWARYSLAPVQQQLFRDYRLLIFYVLLYGGVLTVFGVVVLRRNVVRPVRRLHQAISQVAAGDLHAEAPEGGPREISELATAFNAMTRALHAGQEALLRSERMASVGHLAAGMAHEIGNPLAAVIGYLEVLKSELSAGREREIVVHSLNETTRIDRLVRDLLDYASPDAEPPVPVDPLPIVRETVDLLAHQAVFDGYELVLDSPESLSWVRINPHKLQQVLVNLIGNARDASKPGQAIDIVISEAQRLISLQIRDQGEGIAESQQAYIFDPFFTAKQVGQGRGLGLTICHRIVSEAGGEIRVESQPAAGSTFTVILPAAGS